MLTESVVLEFRSETVETLEEGDDADEDERSVREVRLERCFPRKRVSRDALGFERLHEPNVRPKDRHPGQSSEDRDLSDTGTERKHHGQ